MVNLERKLGQLRGLGKWCESRNASNVTDQIFGVGAGRDSVTADDGSRPRGEEGASRRQGLKKAHFVVHR